MRIKNLLLPLAAFGMAAAPVAASAAPAGNRAAGLSVARAATPAGASSDLRGARGGPGLLAVGILAGIIAIVVIAATRNGNGNGSPKSP